MIIYIVDFIYFYIRYERRKKYIIKCSFLFLFLFLILILILKNQCFPFFTIQIPYGPNLCAAVPAALLPTVPCRCRDSANFRCGFWATKTGGRPLLFFGYLLVPSLFSRVLERARDHAACGWSTESWDCGRILRWWRAGGRREEVEGGRARPEVCDYSLRGPHCCPDKLQHPD